MITGSKISTPIHLDMILRSQRAIFGHRSYEHQLLFEEQFRDDTGPARCGIQDRRVKRTILNALHQAVSGIDMRAHGDFRAFPPHPRSEEHTSELQSLMRISYAVFCLKKKKKETTHKPTSYNVRHRT